MLRSVFPFFFPALLPFAKEYVCFFLYVLPLLMNIVFVTPVGFKRNLSLLDIYIYILFPGASANGSLGSPKLEIMKQ